MNVPTMNKQIIFVDSSVQDYQSLIENATGAQIVILNDNLSGIEQITNALANQKDIEAVHILSHGSEGTLFLGNSPLDKISLETYADTVKQWEKALKTNADILLYGCNVAQTEEGKAFVKRLSQLTKANVAASTTLTGNAKLGGDWNLDFIIGKIQAALAFSPEVMRDYSFVLGQFVNEPFTGATVSGPWIYGKTGSSANPGLTASGGTGIPLPNLNLDTAGSGALRLTSNATNQGGFVLYNSPISSTAGVKVTFDFFAYNGTAAFGSPGDGISFFLVDGTANPTSAGQLGSGLGYKNLTGGYVGVGFDEYGGFVNNTNDSIGVRGSLANVNPLLQSATGISGGIDSPSATNRSGALKRAQIILTPSNAAQPNLLSVAMDLNKNGSFADPGETIIAPFDITTSNGAVPTTFKFGFAGSTGSATNIHEIGNLIYETINPTTAPTLADTVVTLNNIPEDSGTPTGAVGTLISSIAAIGTGQNNITDSDTGAVAGVAITAADTNGSWFYTIDGGTTWNPLGTVSGTNARLLSADANTRIYFQPTTANYNGLISNAITFRAWDQMAGANGGIADTTINGGSTAFSTATDTAAITVTPVNDIPSFTATNPTAVNEDSGAQTVTNWATFNAGATNESTQTATYTVSNIGTPGLFGTVPAIDPNGNLTYTPAADANGTSTFDVKVQDSGGTANGGVDTSTTKTFTITVNSVNDKPSFSNAGNQTLTAWTNTAQTVIPWVNSVTFGPADESGQKVLNYTVTNNDNTLFTTQPSVATDGTLTYTPSGKPGIATVNVQLQDDGGTANSGVDLSDIATFDITIPAPKVNLTASTNTASEAGTTAITFTATAEGNVVGAQTVNFALTGTASDADFTGAIPTQITIPDGSSTGQVTITVNDDFLVEGTETATLTISNPSTGIALGTTTNQSVTITDNDTANITVTPTTGLTTTEAGGKATFTVVLNSQPTADVTIPLTSNNIAEGTVDKASLTFTAANWNVAQTVTVTGVNDNVVDGNIAYNIVTAAATSTDTNYSGVAVADVAVTNSDNDTANITVTPTTGLTTTEAGGKATFTVVRTYAGTLYIVCSKPANAANCSSICASNIKFRHKNYAD